MSKNKVTTNGIVNLIIKVAGVSKENAINIFNIFGSAWKQDNIGLLQSLNNGISVTKRPAKVAKKATTKITPALKTKSTVKTKKKLKKVSGTKTVGKVKLKAKSKKFKENKKLKFIPPTTTSSSTSTATA